MKTVIIHGHFYQPPRENPWSGVIEEQRSAAPFDNWNRKILEECYEANGWSPVLGRNGKIRCIFNNYEYLSFNFGPTLLSWLKDNAPAAYDKIREGDRKSRSRNNGWGNAVAQVYNHIIMPLASQRDRLTQIEWGIRDFQHHFDRDPEGMWLAETAIDPGTADNLVRAGIRYTVLSPWQAAGFTKTGQDRVRGDNNPELWQHPWILPCPSGDLTVFFYHPGLSSDISFQHLLRDADHFYSRVTGELFRSGSAQLPVATDGEIYGHHETLGNMGLSAFLSKIEQNEEMKVTNFAARMQEVAPAGEVDLLEGEEGKGTSWSCSHGVSRWYKDCGCHTGGKAGWDQTWRTPLREGFDNLASETDRIYEKGMHRLTRRDPWEVLHRYIEVLIDPSRADLFYETYGSGKSTLSDKRHFFRLLEGQKFKLFMFTSCGWFFSDIAGIEPLQNMMYAARCIDLYTPFYSASPENILLEFLADAESNEPEKGNGAVLYMSRKYDRNKQKFKVAAALILKQLYNLSDGEDQKGFFKTDSYTVEKTGEDRFSGKIVLKNIFTHSAELYRFDILMENKLFTRMTLISDRKSLTLRPEDLPVPLKKSLMKALSISRNTSLRSINDRFYDTVSQLNEMLQLGIPEHRSLKESVQALLYHTLREITYLMEQGIEDGWESFRNMMQAAAKGNMDLPDDLAFWLRNILNTGIRNWRTKNLHDKTEWAAAYKDLKVLLNASARIPENPATPTQIGMICDVLFQGDDGVRLLQSHPEVREELFGMLNLSQDFHPFLVCGKDKS